MSGEIFVYKISRKQFGYIFLRIAILTPAIPAIVLYFFDKQDELLRLGSNTFVVLGVGVYMSVIVAVGVYLILTPGLFYFSVSKSKIILQYPKAKNLSYELPTSSVKEIRKEVIKSTRRPEAKYFIVTNDNKKYQIPKNYKNPIGKCIEAIKTANPLIKETVEKRMERVLGSEIIEKLIKTKNERRK